MGKELIKIKGGADGFQLIVDSQAGGSTGRAGEEAGGKP